MNMAKENLTGQSLKDECKNYIIKGSIWLRM
jgi:hypothetical protein